MGKTYSGYVRDDDLVEEIDEILDGNEFRGPSHLISVALEEFAERRDNNNTDEFV